MHKKIAFDGFLLGLVTTTLGHRIPAVMSGMFEFGTIGWVLVACFILNVITLVSDLASAKSKEK